MEQIQVAAPKGRRWGCGKQARRVIFMEKMEKNHVETEGIRTQGNLSVEV